MRRVAKVFVSLLAVFAIVIGVLAVLVRFYVTPDRVKAVILPLIEEKVHRQVTLGDIQVGLFSGIELHDLAVAGRDGEDSLLEIEQARLRFQWLPLLARRVIVDEVLLESPSVHLVRDADGTFNIADLLAGVIGTAGGEERKAAGAAPISLLVSDVRVADGRLIFLDRRLDPARPLRIELTGMEAHAAGFVLDGSLSLRLEAQLNGAPLTVNGTLRVADRGGRFTVSLQGVDVRPFVPYLREALPGRLDGLILDLTADVERSPGRWTARGSLAGRDLDLTLRAFPKATLVKAAVRADFDLASGDDQDKVEVQRLALELNGLAAVISGRLTAMATQPHVELAVTVPGLELQQAVAALPRGIVGKAAELAPSGRVRADLQLAGSLAMPAALLRGGTLVLEKIEGDVAGVRPSASGKLTLTAERVHIETLTVRLGEMVAEVGGDITRLFNGPVAELDVNLPRVDLATALAAVPPQRLGGLAGMKPVGQVEARARLSGPLAETGQLLKSAQMTLADVQLTIAGQRPQLSGRLVLAGDRLASEGLEVLFAGHPARVEATVENLYGVPKIVTLDLTARRFPLDPLFQAGGAASMGGGAAPSPDAAARPLAVPVQASGTILIDETAWKGVEIRDLAVGYRLQDNQLEITRMTGAGAGGTFSNTARIDLRPPQPAYVATLDLSKIDADTLITALSPASAGRLTGAMDLQASLQGRGIDWEVAGRNLSGDGDLVLANGRLASPTLVKGFWAFLQAPQDDAIDFVQARSKLRLNGGYLQIDGLLSGDRFKLMPKGTLGIDGSLNLAVDARLSPDVAARLDQRDKVTRYLLDDQGWTRVPLLLGGTLQAPRFSLDPKGAQAQAGRILQQELQRELEKVLPGPSPPPSDAAPAEAPPGKDTVPAPPAPTQKLLEETLKRVLNR